MTADLSLITEKEGLFMPNMKLTTYNSRRLARSAFVLMLDALWIAAAFYLALWVRFEFGVIPVRFLNIRLKYSAFSYPTAAAILLML